MIIEQHYDEEVLIGLLEEADHDSHVPGCETCAGTLESLRDLTSALRDNSVWDERQLSETPAPKTTNMLRAFAERTKAEDAAAGPIVAKLIAAPAGERSTLIEKNPGWRTAGVVRRLLNHVDSINFADPQAAVEISTLAVKIADSIEPTAATPDSLMKLRAGAWDERGYALYYIGSFKESLRSLDTADELLGFCSVSEFELANVRLHRAQVYGDLERIDEALTLVRESRDVFSAFGALRREAAADVTAATLLMRVHRFAEALEIHERIAANDRIDEMSRAFASHNAAICHRELAHLAESKRLFAHAITQFERLNLTSMRARAHWLFARILLAEGRYEEALRSFTDLRSEFAELGLFHELAQVSVDTAEALLMLDRGLEVGEFCQLAVECFAKVGLAYTQGALTALAYLKESAERKTLTALSLGHVRGYFEMLPKRPELLFAHPA